MAPLDRGALRLPLDDWLGRQHADARDVAVSGSTQAPGGYAKPPPGRLVMAHGRTRVLAVRVPRGTGCRLGAGRYHGFDGKRRRQWRGPLTLGGEHSADGPTPDSVARLNQFRDGLIEVSDSEIGATGWGDCRAWVPRAGNDSRGFDANHRHIRSSGCT